MSKVFLCFLCTWGSLLVLGQGNERFTNYNINEGLAQSTVDDIIQDKNGFLWIGTADGLCRFDGYRFTTYRRSNQNPKAINSDRGFHFYNDREGNIWIISYHGLSLYNPILDNFTNIISYEPANVITIENHIFGEDDTYIWAGLCNYGLVKVNKKRLEVTRLKISSKNTATINAWYHGFLKDGKIWGIDNTDYNKNLFFAYDCKTGSTDTLKIPVSDVISFNNTEIAGVHTNQKDIVVLNTKNLTWRTLPIMADHSEMNILSMYKLPNQELLLCSSTRGLVYFNLFLGKTVRQIKVSDPENINSLIKAACAYTDQSGNVWVGTRSEGILKMNNSVRNFIWYRSPVKTQNNIFSIHTDAQFLYMGGAGHGFTIIDKQTGTSKNIPVNTTLTGILNNTYTLANWGNDRLLIIGHNTKNGANNVPIYYTKRTGKFNLLNQSVQDIFKKYWGKGNLRQFITKDTNGSFLVNVGEYLIALDECSNNTLCPRIVQQFPNEILSHCFRDSKNRLWVGTYNKLYLQENNVWKVISLPKKVEIKTINEDDDGNIWMGTPNEIFVLNKGGKLIQTYNEENGLLNGHLYGILKDNHGNMWFSHNKGISVYRWTTKKFEHFSMDDGLQSDEFNAGAYYKAQDGALYFGGINGVTAFYPENVFQNPHNPKVNITGIKLFDIPLKTDSAYWNIRKLALPYTENSISFEFALPEYTNPKKNRYTYIMESVDPSWVQAGERRFTRYTGLRPGKYLFKVNASNNHGVLSKQPAIIEINIIPPFWQTTWFLVLSILVFLLASGSMGIWFQKVRQKKAIAKLELQHRIQLERERISRDLHDNVGTQLSIISKNIEGVINPLRYLTEDEKVRNLQSIGQTSKEVIFTLRETIWALNKEDISLEELSDKLKAFTVKLFETQNSLQFNYVENTNESTIKFSPTEAIHLFRICQEAITNAIKYANATQLEIEITAREASYKIVIADNGVGFDKENLPEEGHYGLANMQFRCNQINCHFTLETYPGKGTKIIIEKE